MKKLIALSVFLSILFVSCGDSAEVQGDNPDVIPAVENVDLKNPVISADVSNSTEVLTALGGGKEIEKSESTVTEEDKGYLTLFLFGFIGGLISLFTPCVFPMIPLTVSFFTKGGSETKKGFGKAIIYGLSIVAVYVILSLPFYMSGTDPEILNEISTGFTLNIIFFAVFLVFAFSFFGFYELTLPSKWANKADKASDVGGFFGIVFMALVLALVSFSCTGPLLGSVLAGSLKDGPVPITMAMFGFGLGLGLPFALFAAFPSILKKMPQSGGWLNTVKVVLGFAELGLALKFLSNADFVYRFGIVHNETFYLIWIILSFATAAYLFGLFKFPHDSPNQKKSVTRLTFAGLFLAFAIYLIPGVLPKDKQMWETNLISGFPPSTWYSWYNNDLNGVEGISLDIEDEALRAEAENIMDLDQLIDFIVENNAEETKIHYHITDYNVGLALSKKSGKPMLLDFTGYACVNCRRMEDNVWPVEGVALALEQYIVVSLYVDDKVALKPELQGTVPQQLADGTIKDKAITSVGKRWATFEAMRFGNSAQPYYALLSPDEYLLTHCAPYAPDAKSYEDWLQVGLKAMDKINSGEFVAAAKTDTGEVVLGVVDYHVDWKFSVNKISDEEYELVGIGDIDEGWHTYSQFLTGFDGPLPTMFTFEESDNYEIVGDVAEGHTHTYFDSVWGCEIVEFVDQANFTAKIKVNTTEKFTLKGSVNFMVCENGACLPPKDEAFEVVIND